MTGFKGSCHCGAVQITIPELPEQLLQCNCSLCTRTGWIGGYWNPLEINILAGDNAIKPYVSGDKTITLWHCDTCGCATHWTPLTAPPDRMGINMWMFPWNIWKPLPVISVDGASW